MTLLWEAAVDAHPLACAPALSSTPLGWLKLEAVLASMLAAIDFRGASGREKPSHVEPSLAPQLLNLLLGLPSAVGEAAWAQ